MIKKRVWRYYCEHCRKGSQSPSCMRRHIESCCKNPARVCFLHADAGIAQPDLAGLIAGLKDRDFDSGLRWLSDECCGCPACMLAAIVQSRMGEMSECSQGDPWYPGFDYKSQLREWYSVACET